MYVFPAVQLSNLRDIVAQCCKSGALFIATFYYDAAYGFSLSINYKQPTYTDQANPSTVEVVVLRRTSKDRHEEHKKLTQNMMGQ